MIVRHPAWPASRQRDLDRNAQNFLARGKTRASALSLAEMAFLKPDKNRNQRTQEASSASRPYAATGLRSINRIASILAQGKAVTTLLDRSGTLSKNRSITALYGNIGHPNQPRH